MSSEDRVTVQIAAKFDCRPLKESLAKCLKTGADCAREKRLLAHCRMLVDDAPAALKPNKQGVTGNVENPSSYLEAGNCSGALRRVKECMVKRNQDRRYCEQQIEDYKTCRMMLETRKSMGK